MMIDKYSKSQFSVGNFEKDYRKSIYYKKLLQKSYKVWNVPYRKNKTILPHIDDSAKRNSSNKSNMARSVKGFEYNNNKANKNKEKNNKDEQILENEKEQKETQKETEGKNEDVKLDENIQEKDNKKLKDNVKEENNKNEKDHDEGHGGIHEALCDDFIEDS